MGFGKGGLLIKKKRLHVSNKMRVTKQQQQQQKHPTLGSTGSGHQSAGAGEKAQDAGGHRPYVDVGGGAVGLDAAHPAVVRLQVNETAAGAEVAASVAKKAKENPWPEIGLHP